VAAVNVKVCQASVRLGVQHEDLDVLKRRLLRRESGPLTVPPLRLSAQLHSSVAYGTLLCSVSESRVCDSL
jgi:hypothetical protein